MNGIIYPFNMEFTQNFIKSDVVPEELEQPSCLSTRCGFLSFVCGTKTPFFGSFEGETCKQMPMNRHITGKCIDTAINIDGTRLVSLHENKEIAFWDLKDCSLMKCHKLQTQMKMVTVGKGVNELFCSDEENNIFKFSIRGVFSQTVLEKKVFSLDENIVSMKAFSSGLLIIVTDKSVFLVHTPSGKMQTIYTNTNEEHFLAEAADLGNAIEVFVSKGPHIKAFKVSPKGRVTLVGETYFEYSISHILFLNKHVAAVILVNGTIMMFTNAFQIVQRCYSTDLLKEIRKHSCIVGYDEHLYFFSLEDKIRVNFSDWKGFLNMCHEKHQWMECFSSAITIFAGTAYDFFGISHTPSERCSQVIEMMKPIMIDSLQHVDNENTLEWILNAAFTFGMQEEVFTTYFEFFQSSGQLDFFFSVLFGGMGNNFIPIAPEETLTQFIEFYKQIDQLKKAESMLVKINIPKKTALFLLKIAKENLMFDLYLKISLTVLKNPIYACNFFAENGKLNEFFERVFLKEEYVFNNSKILKALILWLFTPNEEKVFDRLKLLIENDWKKSTTFISKILSTCPIKLTNGFIIDTETVNTSVLRTIADEDYEQSLPLIETVFPLLVAQEQRIPKEAIPLATKWIFNGYTWSTPRIMLLKLAAKQYPEVVNLETLTPWIKAAGFVSMIDSDSDHYSMIHVLSLLRDNTPLLFKYFDEHYIKVDKGETVKDEEKEQEEAPIQGEAKEENEVDAVAEEEEDEYEYEEEEEEEEEVKKIDVEKNNAELIDAVKKHFHMFVITDPKRAVQMVADYMPDFHKEYVTDSSELYCKWLYLSEMRNSEYKILMDENDFFEYFSLMCSYNPKDVVSYLQENTNIQLEKAIQVCLDTRCTDASIYIYSVLGEVQKAVSIMGKENERILTNLIKSGKKVVLVSADRVSEEPLLDEALQNINRALTALEKAPNAKDLQTKMWKSMFKSFQIPIWLSQNNSDPATKKSIALFFAYFIVEALNRADINMIFSLIRHEFKNMDAQQYKNIFTFLINYLGYRQHLSHNVESIYMEDCRRMRYQAEYTRTRGIVIENSVCAICKQPITGLGGIGMKVFPCGHCCHNTSACGGTGATCPICSGETTTAVETRRNKHKADRITSRKARKLQHVDHGLKSNYGKSSEATKSFCSEYFQPKFKTPATKVLQLNLVKDLPPASPIMLKL